MHTLGYRFKPWIHDKSIADGPSILEYLNETIDENDLRNNILLNHNVNSANWNSDKSIWELKIIEKDLPKIVQFYNYLINKTNYINHDNISKIIKEYANENSINLV